MKTTSLPISLRDRNEEALAMGLTPLNPKERVHSIWGNMLTTPEGTTYVAAGNHETFGGNSFLFRHHPDDTAIRECFSVQKILGIRAQSSHVGEAKIHTRICRASDGRLYMGTMQGGLGHLSKFSHYCHPEQNEGGHMLVYDPQTGSTVDLGILVRHEGIQTQVLDAKRGQIYFVTWPKKMFCRYDIAQREVHVYGVLSWSPTSPEGEKQHFGRDLILAPNGRVYSTNNFGCIVRYDPDRDVLEDTNKVFRTGDSLRAHAITSDGKIYASTCQGYLVRFDPEKEKVEILNTVHPKGAVYTPNLLLSKDQSSLIYFAGSHGTYIEGGMTLIRYDLQKQKHHVYGAINPSFHPPYCYGSTLDAKGRYLFAIHGGEPSDSYLAMLDPENPAASRWLVDVTQVGHVPMVSFGPGSEGNVKGWLNTEFQLLTKNSGGDIPHGQCAISALTGGPDGRIYGGTAAGPGQSAYLFRNHPNHSHVEVLARLGDHLKSAQRVCKSLVAASDGNIYGGTIDLLDEPFQERRYTTQPWNTVPKDYAGGHLFRFEPSSGKIKDLGIPVPGQGIHAMNGSPDGKMIHALTFPHAHLISLDVETGVIQTDAVLYDSNTPGLRPDEHFLSWQWYASRVEHESRLAYLLQKRGLPADNHPLPPDVLLRKYHVSRAIACDAGGRVYGSHGEARIFRYDPKARKVELLENPFPVIFGTEPGIVSEPSIESLIRGPDGCLYGGTCQDGFLFCLNPKTGQVKNLGKPIFQSRIRDLAFFKNSLFGIVGENLGKCHLFSHTEEKGLQDHGVLQAGGRRGFAVNICETLFSGNDSCLYIGQADRISALLHIQDLQHETYQSP